MSVHDRFIVRLADRTSDFLRGFGRPIPDLSPELLERVARRKTGCDDFGSLWYRTPLNKLCESYDQDVDLKFIGRVVCRGALVNALTNRLLVQRELQLDPGIRDESIRRPLFVLGLPRTGTTLLYNLLSQDPACRPLLHWETMTPAPSPRPETLAHDPRIARARKHVRQINRLFPEYATMHRLTAEGPEECAGLLMTAFLTPMFPGRAQRYREWLDQVSDADVETAYGEYRTQLQVLQRYIKGSHWILKCPTHIFAYRELLTTFPDACVVHTHRDLSQCIPSLCSLHHLYLRLCYRQFDPHEAGRMALDIVEQQLRRGIPSRDRGDPQGQRVMDINYSETVQNPIGTVEKIYGHFGYEFTADFRRRIEAFLADDKHPHKPRHQYTMEEYGLTHDDLHRRFAAYTERFLTPSRPTKAAS